ncbi:MAG: hypothetical protein K8S54_13285 [Spirochaetia bacterium]|nr:hypothetical protein [Spirochaetia bacterium]
MNQAHLHLILVHFPVVGSLAALALLLRAYFLRTKESRSLAAFVAILVAGTAGAAYLTGEGAEHQVEKLVLESAIESHESAALAALVSAMIAGGLGLVALLTLYVRRMEGVTGLAQHGLLLALIVSVVLIGIASQRGGSIRHTEIAGTNGNQENPETRLREKDDD